MLRCPSCHAQIGVVDKLLFNRIRLLRCGSCQKRLGHSQSADFVSGLLGAFVLVAVAGLLMVRENGYVQLSAIIALLSLVAHKYSAKLYLVNDLGIRDHV